MNALTDYKHFAYSAAGVQHETRVCRCSDQRNIPNRVEITITETYKHFATATAHVDVLFFSLRVFRIWKCLRSSPGCLPSGMD